MIRQNKNMPGKRINQFPKNIVYKFIDDLTI